MDLGLHIFSGCSILSLAIVLFKDALDHIRDVWYEGVFFL
jgi:hypothetical protein